MGFEFTTEMEREVDAMEVNEGVLFIDVKKRGLNKLFRLS